jgi:alkylation response protein AidB-like acyl-CoA dehydrogenase
MTLSGTKMFCSGAGLVDHALITVGGRLVDVHLSNCPASLAIDESIWTSLAFAETQTSVVHFLDTPVSAVVGEDDWYVQRPGFWHGACGPAACWAGGALGLVDYALEQARDEPHTLAHLGALSADAWAMESFLDSAGRQIDRSSADDAIAKQLALKVRHLIEQASSDVLCRLGRAFGPRPLAFDPVISKRVQELELYVRQCHAERDLESLGRGILKASKSTELAAFATI